MAILFQRLSQYPTISPKYLKHMSRLTDRKRSNRRFVHHFFFLERPTSELAEVIIVVFARVSFIPICEVPFTNTERLYIPFLKLVRRKH